VDATAQSAEVESGRYPSRRPAAIWVLAALWGLLVAAGMGGLWKYAATPGGAADPPPQWPTSSAVPRTPGKATLVMLVHPHCSCSEASIGELELLMARVHDRTTAHVLFVRPHAAPEGWDVTGLWQRAARIPGVTTSWDDAAAEAHVLGAMTSGHTVVYDAGGRLLFHGGITGARGHAGDNLGRARVSALLTRGDADRHDSPVYGCSLEDPLDEG